jgi:hypothetical protein
MVAFSFRPRFVEPILAGTKRHTIRAPRRDGRWPVEGDELQLYTGMRTAACKLICRRTCLGTSPIQLVFDDDDPMGEGIISPGSDQWGYASLDAFAVGDGFANWADLKAFWRLTNGVTEEFEGRIVFWRP